MCVVHPCILHMNQSLEAEKNLSLFDAIIYVDIRVMSFPWWFCSGLKNCFLMGYTIHEKNMNSKLIVYVPSNIWALL